MLLGQLIIGEIQLRTLNNRKPLEIYDRSTVYQRTSTVAYDCGDLIYVNT